MKKVLFVMAAVLAFGFAANAQSNAIGARIGADDGFGAEISYQRNLGSNRLELDLGLSMRNKNDGADYTSFALTGVYQWRGTISGGFGWFAGPGAQFRYFSWEYANNNDKMGLSVVGQVGVEYVFPGLPLQVSLDWRPRFDILPETQFTAAGVGLGIRFLF